VLLEEVRNSPLGNAATDGRTASPPPREVAAKRSTGIYDGIFGLIVSGEFAENARLPSEVELARRFGASRPVVREALARLRDDGLIVSRQGSGSYVRRRPDNAVLQFVPVGSIADIQRCFEFRVGLEGAAAALAAERWQAEELAEIKAAFAALETCIRTGQLGVDADARFHAAVARATHNHYHVSVQLSLQAHIAFGMNLTRNLSLRRPEARLRLVQDEHARILAAIDARDGAAARRAMESHIENARRRMFEGAPTGG
jgi:GntR family transcriptional regulator, transcriptional repressor for pyruvate dehydrogenase complex